MGVNKTKQQSNVTSKANRASTGRDNSVGGSRATNTPPGGGTSHGSNPAGQGVGTIGGASHSVPYKAVRMAKGGRMPKEMSPSSAKPMAGGGLPPFVAAKKSGPRGTAKAALFGRKK